MSRSCRRFSHIGTLSILFLAAIVACSDSSPLGPVEDFTDLIGDWDAHVLEVVHSENASVREDILAQGATFRINFQPSGQYTAVLSFLGASQVEIGTARLDGEHLTLYRTVPSPDTSQAILTWLDGDRIRLEGSTRFDFGSDGTVEDAELLTELLRDKG